MPSNTCLSLSPTARAALEALHKTTGCSMTRIIEVLLIRDYDALQAGRLKGYGSD